MVSWFKYFTEPSSLDEDLVNEDKLKDSDKLKLMKEFLYEADQCDKKMEQSRKQALDAGSNVAIGPLSPIPVFTDVQSNYNIENGRENYIQQMRKSHVLYILALKVFANLRYNINLIHVWGVPLCLMSNLQRTLLKVTTGVPNVNPIQDIEWPGWTGVSRFAQVVYHFWTLLEGLDRVLIKPHKRCLTPPLPGLTDVPDIVFVNENGIEESAIVARLEQSAQILTILLEKTDVVFEVPVSRSFKVPELDADTTVIEEVVQGCPITTASVNANIMFFLGRHCFQRKEFDKALDYFTRSKAAFDPTVGSLFFAGATSILLDSYIALCKKLSHRPQSRFRSPCQVIEDQLALHHWNGDLLADTLMRELFRRFDCRVVDVLNGTVASKDLSPISLCLREQLQREIKVSMVTEADKTAFFKVSVCNLLERVVSGHALLTPFVADLNALLPLPEAKDVLRYLQQQTLACLDFFQGASRGAAVPMETGPDQDEVPVSRRAHSCPNIFAEEGTISTGTDFSFEVQNLKCFVLFLAQSLPPDLEFPASVLHGDLMRHFTTAEEEAEIRSSVADLLVDLSDLDIYDLEGADADWFAAPASIEAGTIDPLQAVAGQAGMQAESDMLRLLASYDCEEIKDVLGRLQAAGAVSRQSVGGLCALWPPLGAPLAEELKNIKNEFDYMYTHVLLLKAGVLREMGSWDCARFLLEAVRSSPALGHHHQAVGGKLRRLLANEITLNDLQRFLLTYEDQAPLKSAPEVVVDLVNASKQALTSARLDGHLPTSESLISAACCLLLTVGEHDYLLSVPASPGTPLELSYMLVTVLRDFQHLSPATKFLKSSKDLSELLLKAVLPSRKNALPAHGLRHEDLRFFVGLLGHAGLLDVLVGGLVSILTCLRSDISLSRPLFPKDVWPTTISSSFNTAIDTVPLDGLVVQALDRALAMDPYNAGWLCTRADLAVSSQDFHTALRLYLEAGAAATDCYTRPPLPRDVLTDWVLQQMVRCCRETGHYHQAVFLCQYIPDIGVAAQLASQVTLSNDSSDLYVHLMWDVNLMEILAAIEYDRGAFSKHRRFIEALSQPDMSANNSPEIIQSVQERKKLEFLRLLSMQYLMR